MNQQPIGIYLAQLETLTAQPESKQRNHAAWETIAATATHPDHPVLVDYALEQGFAQECIVKPNEPNLMWTNSIDGSEMVWIPPGDYVVGPERKRITNPGFSMAKHPVTNEQFAKFLSDIDYRTDECSEMPHPTGAFLEHWTKTGKVPKKLVDHPVVYVTFKEANAYCEWAGLSLPNEYQWEMAAAGKDGQPSPWGNDVTHYLRKPVPAQLGADKTCPVSRFADIRSAFGCANMLGNVSEWCEPHETAEEDSELAIVKGSAYLRDRYYQQTLQHRRRLGKGRRNSWVGFRPAFLLPIRPAE